MSCFDFPRMAFSLSMEPATMDMRMFSGSLLKFTELVLMLNLRLAFLKNNDL